MDDPRVQLVADCDGETGERFAVWRGRIVRDPRREWQKELPSLLGDGGGRGAEASARPALGRT